MSGRRQTKQFQKSDDFTRGDWTQMCRFVHTNHLKQIGHQQPTFMASVKMTAIDPTAQTPPFVILSGSAVPTSGGHHRREHHQGTCKHPHWPLDVRAAPRRLNGSIFRTSSHQWPPYSPDLNPMDYSVWSILQSRTCVTRHKSLKLLKRSLRREWDRLSPENLRPIAENFKSRLDLCIIAKRGSL
ncbi:hypothetical protein LAZ67_17002901 [Cordylochernes scorpioides]|uniref:Tc1-like transposase DDE domain-containing protein n=1 Tax=Cordylochernes scorpioides TaxID=51811 RepID=A0ABY6LE82_9ARAC|nr:hypothetical protein LAZ67_17002901 [Cordylochernes scorpioides]